MTSNNPGTYDHLSLGNWSASNFDSILTQLKEGNTFMLRGVGLPDPKWSIAELSMLYRARSNNGYYQVWVTNDERRRIIKVLNDARIKK